MKVGITVATLHPWEATELTLQVADGVQADSLWAPDHILGVFHPDLWPEMTYSSLGADPDGWYDPFCLGAALSRVTDKPYGISVTDGTRRRAIDVARSTLTLQHLLKGGFILGVGSGEAESLVPFGYDFTRPVRTLEDFLFELRCLLDTGRMPEGPGRVGIPLESAAGKPKVWVAGHGPRMLAITGRYGDGWIPAWPMSPVEYGEKRRTVAKHAAEAGRPEPEAGLLVFVVLGESRDRIAEEMEKEPLAKLFALFAMAHIWQKHGMHHPLGDQSRGFIDVVMHGLDSGQLRDLAPTLPFEMVEEVLFMGNAEEVTGRLEGYATEGLEHVVLGNMTGIVGGMEEIAARAPDVFALRQALGSL